MVECPGGALGCAARERFCLCGVVACWVHGHTADGDDCSCPYLNLRRYDLGEEEAGSHDDARSSWGPEAPPRLIHDISLDRWEDRG